MPKYKFREITFNKDYRNDVVPILLAEEDEDNPINLEKLKQLYSGCEIFMEEIQTYNESTGEFHIKKVYYTGAKAVGVQEYRPISTYDPECPPSNMILEITLQVDKYKKVIYKNISNVNCSMYNLLSCAVDMVIEDYISEDSDYLIIELFDKGGWLLDYEVDNNESAIKRLITSIRLVEEVID